MQSFLNVIDWPWSLKRSHLVEQDTHGPDIALGVVRSALQHLRCYAIVRANQSLGLVSSSFQNFRNAEVTQLHHKVLRQENVLVLDIAMQNIVFVDVLHAETNLGKIVEDLVLGERLIPRLALIDQLIKAALLGILHHNVPLILLVSVGATVRDDVWVVENLQNLRLLLYKVLHLSGEIVEFASLDHVLLVVVLRANMIGRSLGARTQFFNHRVFFLSSFSSFLSSLNHLCWQSVG